MSTEAEDAENAEDIPADIETSCCQVAVVETVDGIGELVMTYDGPGACCDGEYE